MRKPNFQKMSATRLEEYIEELEALKSEAEKALQEKQKQDEIKTITNAIPQIKLERRRNGMYYYEIAKDPHWGEWFTIFLGKKLPGIGDNHSLTVTGMHFGRDYEVVEYRSNGATIKNQRSGDEFYFATDTKAYKKLYALKKVIPKFEQATMFE